MVEGLAGSPIVVRNQSRHAQAQHVFGLAQQVLLVIRIAIDDHQHLARLVLRGSQGLQQPLGATDGRQRERRDDDDLIGTIQRFLDRRLQHMPAIDEHMPVHRSKETDHAHRAACRRRDLVEPFIARREQVQSGRMLRQVAPDDRLIQPGDVLREMLQPLRRMEVQEQSEISAVHVEIHQCHRLPLPGLLHGSREIRGHRARAHPASRPDDADDSARLHLRAGRSPVESLLKPRKGRFHFLARQGLRQKFLHPEPERVQEYLRVRPRGREKHLKIRRGAQQFTDADERLLRAHFVQFEQQHVHRAGPLPFGHQIVPPPRKDLFKRLTSRFVPTVNRHCNQSSHAS